MLEVDKKHHHHGELTREITHTVVLDYDQRSKGRLKAVTTAGQDIGLFLERGKVLRNGDILETKDGELVLVQSAKENLIEGSCDDWLVFSKCCYHLGNRHVPIQIDKLSLRMRPDYILEEMMQQLGLSTKTVEAGFDPESGAYAGGHHHHH